MFTNQAKLFILYLSIFNSFFIGCYFSGVYALQQIIAPTISLKNFRYEQMREFGIMEIFQNVLLLIICYLLFRECIRRVVVLEKLFFGFGCAAFIFLFLEEIDYGLHIYKLIFGGLHEVTFFSWHNKWSDGVENATKMKRAIDLINGVWFFLIPLALFIAKFKILRQKIAIIPSRWFIAGFVLTLLFSKFAHYLDDSHFGVIDGVQGNLHKTIAEFRETSVYYLYFLYAIQLIKTKTLFPVLTKTRK